MKASKHRVPRLQRLRSAAMRHAPTDAEKRLWYALRFRVPVAESHFRRQVPIDRYIVDFCCHRARLIVELDGDQHGTDQARHYDAARTAVLQGEGYRVLRFANEDVWRDLDMVLDTIFAAAAERTPTPGPSPQGGGESGDVMPRSTRYFRG